MVNVEQSNPGLLLGSWDAQTPFEWIVLQPEKDPEHSGKYRAIDYPLHVKRLVWEAVCELDAHLEAIAPLGELVDTIGEKSEAKSTWDALMSTEAKIQIGLLQNEDNVCVGIFHGTAPLWSHLKNLFRNPNYQSIYDRITATVMSSYTETGMNIPQLLEPLAENIKEAHLTYALDDVIDSGHSIAMFLREVLRVRGKQLDPQLVERLSTIKKQPFDKFEPLYDELITLLHQERIVAATSFYKNEPFLNRLIKYLEAHREGDQPDDWVREQNSMLQHVLVFGQHDWIKGRGLDTGVRGKLVADIVRAELMEAGLLDDRANEILEYLDKSVLRVGSFIERLIVLKGDNMDGLIKVTAEFIGKYIKAYVVKRRKLDRVQ